MPQRVVKMRHRSLELHRQPRAGITHHSLQKYRWRDTQNRHRSLDQHKSPLLGMRHRDLNGFPQRVVKMQHRPLDMHRSPTRPVRHFGLQRKQPHYMKMAHRSLEQRTPRYERFRHRDMNDYNPRRLSINHRNLEKGKAFRALSQKQFEPKHFATVKKLRQACYPIVKMKHSRLDSPCYTNITRHKDLSAKCYTQMKLRHRDLQTKCYPIPKVQHQDLSSVCLPKYRVKHHDLSAVCYMPSVKIKHRDLSNMCYPTLIVRHKDMNEFSCTQPEITHTPLSQYKVLCDPNITKGTTTMERIAKEINYWFTRHKRFCDLEKRYSGVTVGVVVETKYGTAVVTDYVVKKDIYYPLKIEVAIAQKRAENGDPRIKTILLSREETKEIMIVELIKRQKYIWLVRMYPEERKNLDKLKELYLDPNLNKAPGPGPGPDDN